MLLEQKWAWGIWLFGIGLLGLSEKKFRQDVSLIYLCVGLFNFLNISTDTRWQPMLTLSFFLTSLATIPYIVEWLREKTHMLTISWKDTWTLPRFFYAALIMLSAYLVLPFYFRDTGAYLNWPAENDTEALIRLFLGINALGIWDEVFFIGAIMTLLRRHIPFGWANFFQALMFTVFLVELGFSGWGFALIFTFGFIQGEVYRRTASLIYIIEVHLLMELFLFLAVVNAYHADMWDIFIS